MEKVILSHEENIEKESGFIMQKRILSPSEVAEATCKAGLAKANKSAVVLILLGILAGLYIGLGGVGATVLWANFAADGMIGWGKFMGAAVFPVGLMLVIMCGSELFTGNNLMTLGCFRGDYKFSRVLRNWVLVYLGNFIGSLFLAIMIANMGLFAGAVGEKAISIATGKVGLSFSAAVIRGVLCNILVVLAVWLVTAGRDLISKIFACWFPIMLFVLCGFEHSVANMYFISVGKFLGADITWSQFWINNLIPVTIGNLIGGAVFIPAIYYFIFIRKSK